MINEEKNKFQMNPLYEGQMLNITLMLSSGYIDGKDETINTFQKHIDYLTDIGPFNTNTWTEAWRMHVYKFGQLFEKKNPLPFIKIIEDKLKSLATDISQEYLYFFLSEIYFNFQTKDEIKKFIEDCLSKFPCNPEFKNNMSILFFKENEFIKAAEYSKSALNIDPYNITFVKNRFNADYGLSNFYIKKNDLNNAESFLKSLLAENFYLNRDANLHNALCSTYARIQDHKLIDEKILEAEKKIKESADKERFRIIEILSFFSAIIAFILSSVSISIQNQLNIFDLFSYLIILGSILILFTISMSLIFSDKKRKILRDWRFWIQIIFACIVIFIFVYSDYSGQSMPLIPDESMPLYQRTNG